MDMSFNSNFGQHVYNQFVIHSRDRNNPIAYMKEHPICFDINYRTPIHLQECFADLGYRADDFRASEQAAAVTLALPINPELTEPLLRKVVASVIDFCSANSKFGSRQ